MECIGPARCAPRPLGSSDHSSPAASLMRGLKSRAFTAVQWTSKSAVGEFSLMRNLCLQTYSRVSLIVTRVATPVMSIALSNSAHLRTVYLNVLRMTSLVNFPLYLALAFSPTRLCAPYMVSAGRHRRPCLKSSPPRAGYAQLVTQTAD